MLKKCLIFHFALKMVIFFLEKCLKMINLSLKITHPDILGVFLWFFTLNYRKLISFQWAKKSTNSNLHLPMLSDLWLDGELHGNSRFYRVALFFLSVILLEGHWECSWNLQKYPWKSPWKVLVFFVWKPVLTMSMPMTWEKFHKSCSWTESIIQYFPY